MDERQKPNQPSDERREPRPLPEQAPPEGGGVAQGDIRVSRHPDEEEQR